MAAVTVIALVVVTVGCVLFTLALPVLGVAALRGSPRAFARITGTMVALATLVFLAALVLGSAPTSYGIR